MLLNRMKKLFLLLGSQDSCLARFTHKKSVAGDINKIRNNVILTDYWRRNANDLIYYALQLKCSGSSRYRYASLSISFKGKQQPKYFNQ